MTHKIEVLEYGVLGVLREEINMQTLDLLSVGEHCVIKNLDEKSDMFGRFTDLGLISGTKVECVGKSPCGDPKAYLIRGAVIAIRNKDCKDIFVEEVAF